MASKLKNLREVLKRRRKALPKKLNPKQRVLIGIGVFFIVLLILFRAILLPFLLSLAIVYLLAPLVSILERKKIARWLGVVLTYAAFLIVTSSSLYFVVPKITTELGNLAVKFQAVLSEGPALYQKIVDKASSWLSKTTSGVSKEESAEDSSPQPPDFGFGPDLYELAINQQVPTPVLDQVRMPILETEFSALEEFLTKQEGISRKLTPEELDEKLGNSSFVISKTADGNYIVNFRPSTIEWSESGSQQYNFSSRFDKSQGVVIKDFKDELERSLWNGMERVASKVIDVIVSVAQGLLGLTVSATIGLILCLMVAAYIVIDLNDIKQSFIAFLPGSYRLQMESFFSHLKASLDGYIRGRLIAGILVGSLSMIFFHLLIPDFAVVLSTINGVLSMIPILGIIASTIFVFFFTISIGKITATLILLVLIGIHVLVYAIVTRKAIKKEAKMNHIVIIFAILAGFSSFGLGGALLAVPIACVIRSVFNFIYFQYVIPRDEGLS